MTTPHTEKKQLMQLRHKQNKEYADHMHKLRLDALRQDMIRKTSIIGLKTLVSEGEIDVKKLKKIWDKGKTNFNL